MNCQRCGEEEAILRNYEVQGKKTSFYHCDSCTRTVHSIIRREERDRVEGERLRRERANQARQEQKEKEWKLSHCHHCGKSSLVYHYIYDKRTGKLTSSTSNATDADNQYVFCTQEHFKTWLNKHKANMTEALRRRGQTLAEEQRALEEQLAHQEELRRILAEELTKATSSIVCAKCDTSKEGQHWVNKQDHKTFCSESCYDNYYAEVCDNCQQKITGQSYYNDGASKTGTLCSDCKTKQIMTGQTTAKANSTANNGKGNSNYSPTPPNLPAYNSLPKQKPNQQSNLNCCVCKKKIAYGEKTNYFPNHPEKKWCNACQPRMEINRQAMQAIITEQTIDIDNLNIPDEDKHVLRAAQRIVRDDDVDVDNLLGIDDEDKEALKELQRQRRGRSRQPANQENQQPFYRQPSFWLTLSVIMSIIAITYQTYRAKKAKRTGKKYNWLTDKIS